MFTLKSSKWSFIIDQLSAKQVKCHFCDFPTLTTSYTCTEKLTHKFNNVEVNILSVAIWTLISPKCATLGEHFRDFMKKEQVVLPYEWLWMSSEILCSKVAND